MATQTGEKPIEKIECGDEVLCADPQTGEYTYRTVARTFVNQTEVLTTVTINGEQIVSTPTHPYYVEGKGWVEACALHAGQTVWLANGTKTTVEAVSSHTLQEPVTVYNFEVEDLHTYFVGDCGVLVHNCGVGSPTTNSQGQQIVQDANGRWRDASTGRYAVGPTATNNSGNSTSAASSPNPWGRLGSPAHRQVVDQIQRSIEAADGSFDTEYYVPSGNSGQGTLGGRFADIAAVDAYGKATYFYQVGRTTGTGFPVQRESLAIADIIMRTGIQVEFRSYNNPALPPIIYMP